MKNGKISVDSKIGKSFGFTSDKFTDDSYLWFEDGCIWISLIISLYPGKGNFSVLMKKLIETGREIIVPTPLGKMVKILNRWGFKHKIILVHGESLDIMCLDKRELIDEVKK